MAEHVVILTGASRGLGAALAAQLLGPDTLLICVARSKNPTLEAAAKQSNAWLDYYLADLGQIEMTEELATNICERLPGDAKFYTLINNAGMIGPIDRSEVLSAREIADTVSLNLVAAMTFTAQFLAVTKVFTGKRRVINISSGLARRPMAGSAVYCATKAALDMATRCAELDEEGSANPARFASLAPGVIDTDMQTDLRSTDAEGFKEQHRFIDMKQTGQLTTPEEAAKRVLAYLNRPDFGANVIADVRDA
jgi:NAD(P)-dependent dehydrogenase (short-subunit alcohol dehydrogenase family)